MIKKCNCGYTLKEKCSKCGTTRSAHPAKFSLSDKYGSYRRKAKDGLKKFS